MSNAHAEQRKKSVVAHVPKLDEVVMYQCGLTPL